MQYRQHTRHSPAKALPRSTIHSQYVAPLGRRLMRYLYCVAFNPLILSLCFGLVDACHNGAAGNERGTRTISPRGRINIVVVHDNKTTLSQCVYSDVTGRVPKSPGACRRSAII